MGKGVHISPHWISSFPNFFFCLWTCILCILMLLGNSMGHAYAPLLGNLVSSLISCDIMCGSHECLRWYRRNDRYDQTALWIFWKRWRALIEVFGTGILFVCKWHSTFTDCFFKVSVSYFQLLIQLPGVNNTIVLLHQTTRSVDDWLKKIIWIRSEP